MQKVGDGKIMKEKSHSKLKIAVMVNVAIFALLGLGFGREYLRNLEIEREIARMEQENDRLEADRLAAVELIETLSSTYYLEGEARTKRNMGLPGETMIVMQSARAAEPGDETVAQASEEILNPLRWFYYFFDPDRFAKLRDV